jgi:hypothetical protein
MRHLGNLLAATLIALGASAAHAQRDPAGETAHYKVDRDSSRTSALFTSGTLDGVVVEPSADGSEYKVDIDWTLRVSVLGSQSGHRTVDVPAEYFSPAFLTDLRINGEYQGPDFKLRWLGLGNAYNLDGRVYLNCDKVLIYDIADSEAPLAADIDDMEITAHIQYGVPVLGAVKMDVSGKYQGQRVKVGADYEAP